MSYKILIAGRAANIVNLNLVSLQSEQVKVVTATNSEEADAILDDSIDAVVIGAGLSKEVRLELYGLILEKTSHAEVFCNAQDLGHEGLESMVKLVVRSLSD